MMWRGLRVTLLPRAVRAELQRVGADGWRVENLSDGYARLESPAGLRWQGRAREILDRLRTLADGAGPDAVANAFADRGPDGLTRT